MNLLHREGRDFWASGHLRQARESAAAAAKQEQNFWQFLSDYASVLTLCGAFDGALARIDRATAASQKSSNGPYRSRSDGYRPAVLRYVRADENVKKT
jgi:hypothetical protein